MRAPLALARIAPIRRFILATIVPACDVLLAPFTVLAALLLKSLRRVGVYRLPASHAIFRACGVFPVRDHYYEPAWDLRRLRRPLDEDRPLPGIDLAIERQLALLGRFRFREELVAFPRVATRDTEYAYDNPNFGPGDAEFLYGMVRLFRPRRYVEIGSGTSTLMALNGISANRRDDPGYGCRVVCVEPYEMPWLERVEGIEVLRRKVEEVDLGLFGELEENDVLFVDSSHVLRPQGDVLRVMLEVLPRLRPGVLVHIHDVFTPADYPAEWLVDQVRLWNEQYLVEAFLSLNPGFEILGAVSHLARRHPDRLAAACPVFGEGLRPCPPSSLWLRRTAA